MTTEDPLNGFIPDYGHIVAYRSPAGPGIRLDAGTAYSGAVVAPHYDSLLVKITASGKSEYEAVERMSRGLAEFRVRGVETNLAFLKALIADSRFANGEYNTRFVDESPELLNLRPERSHGVRLLDFIGDVIVNGSDQVKGRSKPVGLRTPEPPAITDHQSYEGGFRQVLEQKGADGVVKRIKDSDVPLVTDTTFRDAHQSLLATRMRSIDMLRIAPHYAQTLPQLFSVESWGGATFDVSMRFLNEDPWQRLADLSEAMPNLMQQMLLRASNGVGYTNYPDNVVNFFVQQSAQAGVDVFRIFDCLNWVDNMRVAIDSVRHTGKLAEAAICYTGDILDSSRSKYNLNYYVNLAKELEEAGAHILGIKDMAGLLKPAAARKLISELKQEISLPIHLHTHDTSGASAATILAAVEAGVDLFDVAMDSLSGTTSQPCMGSLVSAFQHTEHDTGLDSSSIQRISEYWQQVRGQYMAFESDLRSGASEVYLHEMPGGQFTNLKEQADSLGIGKRWHEVARAYADVNFAFGDIVKVTPSSKVVGDMALMMVASDTSIEEVLDPDVDIAFPESVVSLFAGELGQPPGGFPKALQKKVLQERASTTFRPGSLLESVDLEQEKIKLAEEYGSSITAEDLASHLMYPQVFADFREHRDRFGRVDLLPTHVFFYGMESEDEITITMEDGREVVIRYLAMTDTDERGNRRLFFEVNGQPSSVLIKDKNSEVADHENEKADITNPKHVGAPLPGVISTISVKNGSEVKRGETLLTIEAMKMETAIVADRDATIARVLASVGDQFEAKDLLVELL